jgi:hypothetical protein
MRKSIYFGRRDKDLTALFEGIGDKHGEVSDLIKDLARDGLKYRLLVNNRDMAPVLPSEPFKAEIIQLPSKPVKAKIGSRVFQVDEKKELERKLDNLL